MLIVFSCKDIKVNIMIVIVVLGSYAGNMATY